MAQTKLGDGNVIIARGCSSKFSVQVSGLDPADLVSVFSTSNYDFSAALVCQGTEVSLGISVTGDDTMVVTVDETIFSALGLQTPPRNSYSATTIPAFPAWIKGVNKSDGKTYMIAQYTIQVSPGA